MGAYAWYYYAGLASFYWCEAYKKSATQFAYDVSEIIGKPLGPEDISKADSRAEFEALCRRSLEMIYIP